MAAKRKMGRPSTYTKEIGKEVCLRMALGETVANIVKDEYMPSKANIFKWRQIHPDFSTSYACAREDQMHTWSDEIVSLIDSAETGYEVKVKLDSDELERIEKDGFVTFRFNRVHLEHAKAKADVRKFLMAKIVPAVFGDRLQVDATHTIESKDDAELVHALQEAARKAGMEPEDVVALMNGKSLQ